MSEKIDFLVRLEKFEPLMGKKESSSATGIVIPFDVEKAFGARRVPVKAYINGAEYRGTVTRMNGHYVMVVPKSFREAAGVSAGETIKVEIERDAEERMVSVPPDLARALKSSNLLEAWQKLSYTHRKEYVFAIEEAKKDETRARRIAAALDYLAAKNK